MKRILSLLSAAVMVISAASCKKDTPLSSEESKLIGHWACAWSQTNDEAPYVLHASSLVFNNNRTATLYWGSYVYQFTYWSYDGGNLVLKGDVAPDESTLEDFSEKQMTWIHDWNNGHGPHHKEIYVNVGKNAPGRWTVKWPGKSYFVDFLADGTSHWETADDLTYVGAYSWSLAVNSEGRTVVQIRGGYNTDLIIKQIVNENYIVVHSSKADEDCDVEMKRVIE